MERCLHSVLEQRCEQVEHLIMDGGSTDGTCEIVTRFSQEFSRIRLISERDAGQSDAMNKGVRLANAPVISFLNADDAYEPGTLGQVLELLPSLPEPGFLVGNCNVRNANGQITWINRPSRLGLDDLLVGSLKMQHPLNPSAYFYHRSLHELVGPYDVNDEYTMDLEFLLRALPAANIRYVNEVWGNFHTLPGSKTFDDGVEGLGRWRGEALLNRTLSKLPQPRRTVVKLRRILDKMSKLPGLLVYYSRHPRTLAKRVKVALRPVQIGEPRNKGNSSEDNGV